MAIFFFISLIPVRMVRMRSSGHCKLSWNSHKRSPSMLSVKCLSILGSKNEDLFVSEIIHFFSKICGLLTRWLDSQAGVTSRNCTDGDSWILKIESVMQILCFRFYGKGDNTLKLYCLPQSPNVRTFNTKDTLWSLMAVEITKYWEFIIFTRWYSNSWTVMKFSSFCAKFTIVLLWGWERVEFRWI